MTYDVRAMIAYNMPYGEEKAGFIDACEILAEPVDKILQAFDAANIAPAPGILAISSTLAQIVVNKSVGGKEPETLRSISKLLASIADGIQRHQEAP